MYIYIYMYICIYVNMYINISTYVYINRVGPSGRATGRRDGAAQRACSAGLHLGLSKEP